MRAHSSTADSRNAFYARYEEGGPLNYIGGHNGSQAVLEASARDMAKSFPAALSIHLLINGQERFVHRCR